MGILDNLQVTAPDVKAFVGIVRLLIGDLDGADEELIRDVAAGAVEEPWLWDALLGAIDADSLRSSRASALLTAAYERMGPTDPAAREFVEQARKALESRRSNLDVHAIWDRLALPMPHPEAELAQLVDGRMPPTPIGIASIELRDVRGIHHLKLTPNPPTGDLGQWLVVLGPNGIGKTTLLRSLALALRNVRDPAIWPKGVFAERWLRASPHREHRDRRIVNTQIAAS